MAPPNSFEPATTTDRIPTMTDNENYNLARRIAAAREKADTSLDPADHRYAHALQGAASAEVYRTERAANDEIHGTPDPDTFPEWSEISEPGTAERGPFTPDPE
jgi:hypothetical protein